MRPVAISPRKFLPVRTLYAKTMNLSARRMESANAPLPASPWEVMIAEDHVFVRELMTMFLARDRRRYRVVAEVATVTETLAACHRHQPHLLILDVNLPGMSGIEALPLLRAQFPTMRVLICSGSVDQKQIGEALRAGPDGFIEKTSSRHLFLEAVATVLEGGNYYCERSRKVLAELATKRHQGARFDSVGEVHNPLTSREKEVLRLIANGRTSKEVAQALGVSEGTIVTHRANLMRKLALHNASSLTRYALEQGLAH